MDDPVQDVVGARVLTCVFDGDHVLAILHHTNHRLIAAVAVTDAANFLVGQVATLLAVLDPFPQGNDRISQALSISLGTLENEQSEPQGRFFSDPRLRSPWKEIPCLGSKIETVKIGKLGGCFGGGMEWDGESR